MTFSYCRQWFLLLCIAVCGCSLDVSPFAGTVVQMTITGATPDRAGQHLELWARDQYDDVVRVTGSFDYTPLDSSQTTRLFPYGITIRPAVTMDDPCMIDVQGRLLTKAEAYSDSNVAGVRQSPEEQAQQVRTRIAQLTSTNSCDGSGGSPVYHCGHQSTTLLAAVAYELDDDQGHLQSVTGAPPRTCETLPSGQSTSGCIPYDAAPADRLAACRAFFATSPLAYAPNPLQITAPIHGALYGVVTYMTTTPPSAFSSIRLDSNVKLSGARELWMTTESDQVDPLHRGPIFLDGTTDRGGQEVDHFDLTPPLDSTLAVSGTAVLLDELDQDPVQF
jgi:hypothetical protein